MENNSKENFLDKEKKWKTRYYYEGFREKIKPFIIDSKKHLDFGCGFGFLAYFISKDYPKIQVYGFDIDRNCIKIAKQYYKRNNLHFICTSNITQKFDSISVYNVLHHLDEKVEKFLRLFYKKLNLNGKIIIRDFRKVSKDKFKKWYDKKVEEGIYKDSFELAYKEHNRWTSKQFSDLMKKIGFKTIIIENYEEYGLVYIGRK
jgi:2-polyprenyl-3-methyl-5-hydroxy-6-metoxy-1,4-benzoquinol methylase